jgi:hypothetical protein
MCGALTRHGLEVLCSDNSIAICKYAAIVRPDAIIVRTDEQAARYLEHCLPTITMIRGQGAPSVPTLLWTGSPLPSSVRTLAERLGIGVVNSSCGYAGLVRGIKAVISPPATV